MLVIMSRIRTFLNLFSYFFPFLYLTIIILIFIYFVSKVRFGETVMSSIADNGDFDEESD